MNQLSVSMSNLVYSKPYKYCPNCRAELVTRHVDDRDRLACPKCEFVFWNNPKPVVSLLITKGENDVLMVRRAKEPLLGYWCLPGGFLEYEETPESGIKREVKEELGLNVEVGRIIGVYRIDNDPRGIHLDMIFIGKIQGEPQANEELMEWRYFNQNELPSQIAYKHREAISDYYFQLKRDSVDWEKIDALRKKLSTIRGGSSISTVEFLRKDRRSH